MFTAVSAVDNCRSTIAEYTSLTFSFAPGELSTGEPVRGPKAAPFNFADLPCPPPSVVSANWYYYHPGMPYRPHIIPPPQIYQLHPHFSNCFAYPGSVYDPPFALTPQIVLTPFTTAAGAPGGTSSVDPAPVPSIPKIAPLQTSRSPSGMDTNPVVATSIPTTGDLALDPAPESSLEPDPHTESPPSASQPSQGYLSQDLSTQTLLGIISSTQNLLLPKPTPTEADHTTAPITIELDPSGPNTDPLQSPFPSLDNLAPPVTIHGTVFSLNPSVPTTSSTIELPHALSSAAITLSGQVFTPKPTGFVVAGKTVLPNDPALSISGIRISLNPSFLIIGTSTIPFLDTILSGDAAATPTSKVYTHDAPAALPGTSTVHSEIGQAVTISGNPTFSPQPAGLVLGSTEIAVNGQTFTAAPTGYVVDNVTILRGSPAITISGTIAVSLDAEGTDLVIGTRTISLPQTTAADGLAGLIMSGFGSVGQSSSSAMMTTNNNNNNTIDETIMPFSGNGGRRAGIGWVELGFSAVGIMLAWVMELL